MSSSSKPIHHHIKSNCEIIDNIISNMPEIAHLKEPLDARKTRYCRHNSICYEAECGFKHTYTIEARKKIRNAFLKEMKENIHTKIREHKPNYNATSKEYEQMKSDSKLKKREEHLSESRTTPMPFYSMFKTSIKSAKKHLFQIKEEESIIKINKWKDKIVELIYNFTISEIRCNTFDECIEIINIIYDIIKTFIIRPNTMIEKIPETYNSLKNIYNYRRYRIFNKYLKDYNIILNDSELLNSEFIKASEELIEILNKTQIYKNEYCIDKFSSLEEI